MMTGNLRLTDFMQICSGIKPIDFNAAAQAGDWVSMKNYQRMAVVFFGRAGSAGTDLTLTLEQATAVAGTGAKALNFTEVFKKEGADLLAIGEFTKVTQAAGNTFTFANNEGLDQIYVIDMKAEDLDIANDFDCVRVSCNAGNAAKIVSALYMLWEPRYGKEVLPSAIID
jgi:hypothetical protein